MSHGFRGFNGLKSVESTANSSSIFERINLRDLRNSRLVPTLLGSDLLPEIFAPHRQFISDLPRDAGELCEAIGSKRQIIRMTRHMPETLQFPNVGRATMRNESGPNALQIQAQPLNESFMVIAALFEMILTPGGSRTSGFQGTALPARNAQRSAVRFATGRRSSYRTCLWAIPLATVPVPAASEMMK
jgi:hypothetical protein